MSTNKTKNFVCDERRQQQLHFGERLRRKMHDDNPLHNSLEVNVIVGVSDECKPKVLHYEIAPLIAKSRVPQ
jgi:hypothetical protein